MGKHENDTANPDRAGGCCCSGKKNSAQIAEAVKESIPASDPSDWTSGRDEQAASCCQSSKATPAKKENRDAHRP